LAKPLKQSKKFISQSSGLSIMEKASSLTAMNWPVAGVKVGGGGASSTSIGGSGAGYASTRVLDLYVPPKPR
jgi:hypothetical protein